MRLVAVLFLLLTGVDLAAPQLCGEENVPLFRMRSDVTVLDAAADTHPSSLPTEDCFCCCSHIVRPAAIATVTALSLVSAPIAPASLRLPLAPVQSQFHPPRSA